jgi:hypothetical protein
MTKRTSKVPTKIARAPETQPKLNLDISTAPGEVLVTFDRPISRFRVNSIQADQLATALRNAAVKSSNELNDKIRTLAERVGGPEALADIAQRAGSNGGPVPTGEPLS